MGMIEIWRCCIANIALIPIIPFVNVLYSEESLPRCGGILWGFAAQNDGESMSVVG